MLKVLSDIILGIDTSDLTVLVLFDVSAAFDIVDHHILLQRLKRYYGLTDSLCQWLQSYLVFHRKFIETGSYASSPGSQTDTVLVEHC